MDDDVSEDEDLDTLFERNDEVNEELSTRGSPQANLVEENDSLGRNENTDAGGNEAANDDEAERRVVAPKKKIVRKPQPKLNADRICSKQGISLLPKLYEDMKFKGKGYEKEDLNKMLGAMEHWAHRLFPQLPFDTMLERIEKLGSKKPIQVYIKKMRMGLLLDMDEDRPIVDSDDENATATDRQPDARNNDDLFEELLREAPSVDRSMQEDTNNESFTQGSSTPAVVAPTKPMSEELRLRVERNRQLALERKRARQEAQTMNISADATPVSSEDIQ